jgi:hypothetical protein
MIKDVNNIEEVISQLERWSSNELRLIAPWRRCGRSGAQRQQTAEPVQNQGRRGRSGALVRRRAGGWQRRRESAGRRGGRSEGSSSIELPPQF